MKKTFIYQIECLVNGKLYIGVSSNPISRLRQHFSTARLHPKTRFHYAIRKYGESAFDMSILYGSTDRLHSLELEKFFIEDRQSLAPNGYNFRTGGESGSTFCEEVKKKLSIAARQRPLGRKQSTEWVERRTKHRRGKPGPKASIESKLKNSISHLGSNNHFFGKNHTIEAKAKMKFFAKNRPRKFCEKCKTNIDVANYARWHGEKCQKK